MANIPGAITTPKEALTYILSLPLRFGDAGMIEALKLLRAAEELVDESKTFKCLD